MKCALCTAELTGPWRTLYRRDHSDKPSCLPDKPRFGWWGRRQPETVCVYCYALYDLNGNRVSELEALGKVILRPVLGAEEEDDGQD
jgi:hypothetical protein